MQIILATGNTNKVREIKSKFINIKNLEFTGLLELPDNPEIIENGNTFEKNAIIKATTVARHYNQYTLADDSGLEVDALNGRPGVLSARYGGAGITDQERNLLLLKEMEGITQKNRTARFVCVIAISDPNGKCETVRGELSGEIGQSPSGSEGFGYDPIFYLPDLDKTVAELSPEEKNKISHRGKALDKAYEFFASKLTNHELEQ